MLILCSDLSVFMQKDMEENEIKGRKVAIDIEKANSFGLRIMVASGIMFLVPFFIIWGGKHNFRELFGAFSDWGITFILAIVGIVIHELIHGLTWACFAKIGLKSISFGVWWKMLTPYCHCNEPMPIPYYMIAAMMPCIVLGVIPTFIALLIGSLHLLALGIFFIASGSGDIWMTWLLTKENPKSMVLDHPSEAGFYIID